MRQDSFIVNAQISVKVIRRKVTDEGEMYHDVEPIKVRIYFQFVLTFGDIINQTENIEKPSLLPLLLLSNKLKIMGQRLDGKIELVV